MQGRAALLCSMVNIPVTSGGQHLWVVGASPSEKIFLTTGLCRRIWESPFPAVPFPDLQEIVYLCGSEGKDVFLVICGPRVQATFW